MLRDEVTVLRRSNSALPVLFMSGAISRRQISGFRGRYLQKPFSQGNSSKKCTASSETISGCGPPRGRYERAVEGYLLRDPFVLPHGNIAR